MFFFSYWVIFSSKSNIGLGFLFELFLLFNFIVENFEGFHFRLLLKLENMEHYLAQLYIFI